MTQDMIPFSFELREADGVVYFDPFEDWEPPMDKVEWKDSNIFFSLEFLSTLQSLVEIQNITMSIEDEKAGWWEMGFNISVIGTIENITMLKLML